MKYLVSFLIFLTILSCNTTEEKPVHTYFGGEIVNPLAKYVLFLKDDRVIDTLMLNKDNRFMTSFKEFEEGLYTFKHGIEFQYVYLEPADSVLVRLNTWDFDESLVFNGSGGSKNEFLINLFLQNEKEEKEMYKYFYLDEKQFEFKLDSLAKERQGIFNQFSLNENIVSKGFQKLTNTAIHYPLYRLKEIYPYYYKSYHKQSQFPELSDEFYAFREKVNLNETHLISFYPYQNYVINYLYNLAHIQKENDPSKSNITINVLNATVENIQSEEIKNTLLKRIVVNDFLKSESTCTINKESLNIFLSNCTNDDYVSQVKDLVNDSKYVKNNEMLPDFEVVSYTNNTKNISNIIKNKKAVLYFWSTEFMSSNYIASRIKYLKNNHPSITFVGIQLQPGYINVAQEPNLKQLSANNQFKLSSTSDANKFLTSRYPRIIIVNNDGIVKNGFTYLDSKKLGKELKKLEIN